MAELAVAAVGVFLSPLLGVAIDRISEIKFEFFKEKQVIKFDEDALDRLNRALVKISKVLKDAEVKEGAEAVRSWLGKVRAEVNHAEDLLDEFNTECKRLQLSEDKQTEPDLKAHQPDLKAHRCCFPFRKPKSSPGYAHATLSVEEELREVTARLEGFVKEIKELGLQKSDHKEKLPHREPSSSVVDKSEFFGRDDEKEKMIERVMMSDGGAPDVSVIAITGMGGIGKTTLAKHVYNDDRVKEKFQTIAWVCVSEEYDALKVTKDLLRQVNSAVVDIDASFNDLQVKLRENLAGKCFLIILDDIWNENPWNSLKTPLSYGSRGSKIIVTTRNEKIARMVQNEPFHPLHPMSEDQSWRLFRSQAFGNGDHTPMDKFEEIGKEIVKKCKGLPLAIKTVAGALRPEININEWRDFLSSEIWATKGDIIPALSLSYKHLPSDFPSDLKYPDFHSDLKSCFAFCSLFPKDVPFEKDMVVLLWMANDLIKPSTQKAGRRCFEELKSRSFFDSVSGEKYLMHDLINDLARSVAGNTCIRLEAYQDADPHQSIQQENLLPPELLHLTNCSSETSKKFEGLSQVRGLRTFLSFQGHRSTFSCSYMFPRLKRLRALNLSGHNISMVPDSLGDLKHLRFLNLESTKINKLPKAICKCLNLQTLILKNCKELVELPEEMRFLINLQQLDIRGVGDHFTKKMATWLITFKDIQKKISVVVDKIQGSELELLVKLQICDSLNIIGLGDTDVATVERANIAGVIGKDGIENLSLEWSGTAEFPEDELNKFAKLQPHTNTKKLIVKGYKGTRFPDWLGDSKFSNIESLSLEDCKNCLSLPPLGQLTGLKILYISGMDGISEIGEEFYGDASTSKPFQALQELEIINCNNMLSFPEGGLEAPNLKTLEVYNCSKMKSLPARMHTQLPLLTQLTIRDCPEIECFPEGGLPSTLETLHIRDCSKLKSLPARMHTQLPLLTQLTIRDCPEIECFPEGGLPSTLETLHIRDCSKLKSLPARMHTQLPLLTQLTIRDCPEIECFPEGGLPSSLETLGIYNCSKMRNCQTNWGLQTLPSLNNVFLRGFEDTLFPEEGLLPTTLQDLDIIGFSKLESLNEKGLQHLCSLQSLWIWDCPNLQYLPQQKFSSSLSDMTIHDCKLVESFPEALASSLSTLYITRCPKLVARIEREKGEDWPNVSHIPEIYIDGEPI